MKKQKRALANAKASRDHDYKCQKGGKGPAEDRILLQLMPESRPGQQKFLTQLLDESVKELGIGLQPVTKAMDPVSA